MIGRPTEWRVQVCDRACKTKECGFDGGDCGPEVIHDGLLGFNLYHNSTHFTVRMRRRTCCGPPLSFVAHHMARLLRVQVPAKTSAFYVNLTDVFNRITSAAHENPAFVRTAVITQKHKLLTVLLQEAEPKQRRVEIFLEGTAPEGASLSFSFNVSSEEEVRVAADPNSAGEQADGDDDDDDDDEGDTPQSAVPDPAAQNVNRAVNNLNNVVRNMNQAHQQQPAGQRAERVGQHRQASDDDYDDDEEAGVESVPEGDDEDSEATGSRRLLSTSSLEDLALAEQIAAVKRKELVLMREFHFERAFARAERRARERNGGNEVWPWEVQLEPELDRLYRLHVLPEPGRGSATPGRRLLDTFGDSLRHVNLLYNKYFGKAARKVPAHMPHMIIRPIMEELQATWPAEFDATSSHRFRHPKDMQFSFSYFYFMMQKKRDFSLEKEFNQSRRRPDPACSCSHCQP
jgi:hypothetical protein